MFFAGHAEGPFRCADSFTYLYQIERRVRVRFQIFFELRDNHIMATAAAGHLC